jgi:hypothetical protein
MDRLLLLPDAAANSQAGKTLANNLNEQCESGYGGILVFSLLSALGRTLSGGLCRGDLVEQGESGARQVKRHCVSRLITPSPLCPVDEHEQMVATHVAQDRL